ncbi:four-helix bundle copper-binding protein [Haladaptatus sp. DYSN1]|uniref:four-helix bundle copper-binding protein n=1 Tax=unclassified Haladaptatus TaxID=2622732 RepID=UPI0024056C98|nr:four-helix bundle copper-binding protein [Haladaptatus sp. DYSN1]
MSLADTVSEISHLSDEQQECIENCTRAAEVCEWCADACADEDGMGECIRLCRDVADIASLHARFMARDSDYSNDLASICADLCEACAEECEQHDHDHCQLCAEVLPECAKTCRQMASA